MKQPPAVRRSHRAVPVLVLWALLAAAFAQAAALPKAVPSDVGLSAERLARLGAVIRSYVDADRLKGAVVLIARNGRIAYDEAFGALDPSKGTPMVRDAIFRIASQTKAVTTAAVLTLFEEGRLLLDDPVANYIPELAASRVAVPIADKKGKGYKTVPLARPITIRHLLTHTAGISYGDGPARAEYEKAGIHGWNLSAKDMTIGEVVRRLASLPFDAQPGEKWVYGYNTDILGDLVERVSGMNLAEYIEKRITGPLGMEDTHFFLPQGKLSRFTPVYGAMENGRLGLVEAADDCSYVKGPRTCYAGGAGLLSTAGDYARFLQMLLDGGTLDGARVLGPKTVALMTADHAGRLYEDGTKGFGLGFWVMKELGHDGLPGTPGMFGWGGAYHTTYWVDPAEKLVVVFMTQLLPSGDSDMHRKLRVLTYQAIVESYVR